MEYNGRVTDDEKIALIGKGLCFDSGGYNLKPGNAMKGMHGDMGLSLIHIFAIYLRYLAAK